MIDREYVVPYPPFECRALLAQIAAALCAAANGKDDGDEPEVDRRRRELESKAR